MNNKLVERIIKYNRELRKDRLKMLKSWKDDLIYLGLPTKCIDERIKYYGNQ